MGYTDTTTVAVRESYFILFCNMITDHIYPNFYICNLPHNLFNVNAHFSIRKAYRWVLHIGNSKYSVYPSVEYVTTTLLIRLGFMLSNEGYSTFNFFLRLSLNLESASNIHREKIFGIPILYLKRLLRISGAGNTFFVRLLGSIPILSFSNK